MIDLFIALDAATTTGSMQNDYSGIIMIVALIAIFYFMMIRPQQKRQKQIRQFREGIKEGDRIITAGGLHGRVASVKDTYFVIDLGNAIKVKIDKNSVYPSAAEAQQDEANNPQAK